MAVGALLMGVAIANPAFPSPGEYRIDSETTTRSSAGGLAIERVMKVEGDSGRTAVTTRDSTSGPAAPQVFAGEGPNRHCVPVSPAAPPLSKAALAATACTTSVRQLDTATAATRAVYSGVTIEERWQRIDERTWERQIKQTMTGSSAATAQAGRAGLDAMASMPLTPAQRAELEAAKAAMPSQAQVDGAMASVVAELEREAKSGNPEDAAAARQALAVMRGQARPVGEPITETKERWRRVADTCSER